MDETKRRVVGYLHQQISAGHSEEALREHLQKSGWNAEQIDKAFSAYHAVHPRTDTAVTLSQPELARARSSQNSEPKKGFGSKKLVAAAVVVVALLGVGGFMGVKVLTAKPSAEYLSQVTAYGPAAKAIAAGIVHFRSNYDSLPKMAAVNSTPNVFVLCGETCATESSVVVNLPNYAFNTDGVKVRPFGGDIKAPGVGHALVVTDATCNEDKTALSPAKDSAAVFYGIQDGEIRLPQCLSV